MGELSESLNQASGAALAIVRAHPLHLLRPAERLPVYLALGPEAEPVARRARGLLAIWSVQRVLPRVEDTLSDFVAEILELASAIVDGRLAEDGQEIEQMRQHIYSRLNYHAWADPGPDSSYFAAEAAEIALEEAAGCFPLPADTIARWQTVPPTARDQQDMEDAAATAAVAYAWDDRAETFDPVSLDDFWDWWLRRAIPASWDMASLMAVEGAPGSP